MIVDSAPVLPVSYSVAPAGSVDGMLVVAHAGRATHPNVFETLERPARADRGADPRFGALPASQVSKGYYAEVGYGPPPAAKPVARINVPSDPVAVET